MLYYVGHDEAVCVCVGGGGEETTEKTERSGGFGYPMQALFFWPVLGMRSDGK